MSTTTIETAPAEVVADEMDEELARLDLALVLDAVDRDGDRPGGRNYAQIQLLSAA